MRERTFKINRAGCSIACLQYEQENQEIRKVVLYAHGFGGHKETRAAARVADFLLSKRRGVTVLCFDWPCHGEDARKKLLLADCDLYLSCLIEHVREQYPEAALMGCATSFGGYLFLKYIGEHGNPFEKAAFRSPALPMHEVLARNIIRPEEAEKLAKGKDVLVGFDRKIKISAEFIESLRLADVSRWDYTPYCDDLLILHGTKDEIVPIAGVEDFAERNRILFFPVEKADHRFLDPVKMQEAVKTIDEFLDE